MRTVRPIFARNAEFGDGHIDTLSQVAQLRSGVNSDPENTRSLCSGEESVSASANFEPARFNPPQTFGDGLDLLLRLLSDELQRNVQRLRPHPFSIGREALYTFEEALNPRADFRVKIDADEYSHLLIRVLHNALQQRPADHLQRLLRCELADALAVAGKIAFDDLRAFLSRKRDVDQAHRLPLGPTSWAGDPSDSDSITRQAALADAFGHRRRHFAAHRPVLVDQRLGNIRKLRFQFVRVHDGAAKKIARAAAERSDALGQQSTGTGFGHGQCHAAHLQQIADDLLDGFTFARKDGIA